MARTTNLYRTPPDPGFVGGYNWAGVIAGVALLIAVNIAATQFIAYRFAYQTALGGPLLQVRGTSVYQPFAWASWLLKHGASPNPKVRLPLLGGAPTPTSMTPPSKVFSALMKLSNCMIEVAVKAFDV